jgi:hypothetical protein
VDSSVAAGDYTFTVSDNCGNTETVTITKKGETPAYFDEASFAYFSPRGLPVDAADDTYDSVEHFNHSRDGFINGHVYDNGIVTYIDGND